MGGQQGKHCLDGGGRTTGTNRMVTLLVAALVVVSTLFPIPAVADGWRPRRGSAIDYLETRSGSVSFAVLGPHAKLHGYRERTTVPLASVVKAMLMATYLRMGSVRDRKLNDTDRSMLAPMIKRSDNDAATRIANIVQEWRIERLARDANMRTFNWTRPWGLSTSNAVEQAKFLFRIERYIPRRHEGYARYLLSHIVESQQWGIASLDKPNWKFFFKGGWGSGTGWVCHQVGFFERDDGKRIGIAIMITDSPSHDYATTTMRGIARRLLEKMP